MRGYFLAGVLTILCACGSTPPKERPAAPAPALAVTPADEGRRFPMAGQISMRVVNDQVLGKDFLPGGNVAEYKRKGRTYQQFLVRSTTPEAAALLLFEHKSHLRDAKFLAHMGGYYGMDGDKPVYIFQKGAFLAGFVGLPEKEADILARQFAARL
jgi:hypothetical protein